MTIRISSKSNTRGRHGGLTGIILLTAGIVGAALILRSRPPEKQEEKQQPAIVAEFDTVMLPVPARPVPAGTKVEDIILKTVAFPRHQLPEGALTSVDRISGAVAATALPAHLPLFEANFSMASPGTNPVLERIPPGMRAMTIRVDATSAVEGWAGSGSVVDVLLIEKDRTSVIAEKVKILSAERSVSPVEGASAPSVPSTVTVLVSQEQCLAINTAIPLGRIAFALRSNRDEEGWEDAVFTSEKLKGGTVSAAEKETVTGYVALRGDGNARAYALSNGKWIRTEVVPRGFLAGEQ